MNQAVTDYINNMDLDWQREMCNQIREVIYHSIPNIEEQVKYRQAFYTLEGKQICVFFSAKNWINVTLFHAESVESPEGFFEPSTKADRKTLKIGKEQSFDYDQLASILFQLKSL